MSNPFVQTMGGYVQHSDISCLSHSISVSYYSYSVCRLLKLDRKAAARGALLHDFFLYDWHKPHPDNKLHGFTHPQTALKNSNKHFKLNDVEQDIILKHMWPLTLKMPKYKEAFIVCMVDKVCTVMEILGMENKIVLNINELPV